ncbi:hypothetical protein [Streptomyces sp. NPDC051636]|uniref:hypothetical protein n=1 Tax=Streptomyces sp. NPDC051636 TaxID=3365663 RepID=UPI0037A156EA
MIRAQRSGYERHRPRHRTRHSRPGRHRHGRPRPRAGRHLDRLGRHPLPPRRPRPHPHKAVRRVADHLIDHLAELEARPAGADPQPDHWHASAITTAADLAPFTAEDLDDARSRLTRPARVRADRLDALTDERFDASPGAGWSLRRLAAHLAESTYYADSVGDLS